MLREKLKIKEALQRQIVELQAEVDQVDADIEQLLADQLAELRRLQAKEFGAVNLVAEGIKVVQTIPKKVDWDQEKLGALFERIQAAGDDPRQYMRLKFDIPEKQFDAMDNNIRAFFLEARTVKPGKPSFKFEEVDHA